MINFIKFSIILTSPFEAKCASKGRHSNRIRSKKRWPVGCFIKTTSDCFELLFKFLIFHHIGYQMEYIGQIIEYKCT